MNADTTTAKTRRIVLSALLASFAAVAPAAAEPEVAVVVPAATGAATLDYFVVDHEIAGLLEKIATDADVRIQPSDSVRGRIAGERLSGTVTEVLDRLAAERDLDWFVFNDTYYLTARHETKARMIRLGALSYDDALEALTRAGLTKDSFPVQPAADGTAMLLSGPAIYLGFSEAVIESTPATPGLGIRVRRAGQLSDAELSAPAAPSSTAPEAEPEPEPTKATPPEDGAEGGEG
jgi:type II secretory pathway component GspD/PulD (secretin)